MVDATMFSCLTLNPFICQRKIKILLKKKMTFKNAPTLAAENAQKVGGKNPRKLKKSSQVNGLAQNCKKPSTPTQWVRVE